ncbi:MAG: heparinase II/III family protein [Lysobacter sp.]|nr:heparinase II/III family protein [Lysobacter sp.]
MPPIPRSAAVSLPPRPRGRGRLPRILIAFGAVAAAGIALAGPADLLRDLRQRFADRAHTSPKPAATPGGATATATDPRFAPRPRPKPRPAIGNSSPQLSEIPMNLTFLDTSRSAYTRFRTWVDNAVNGNPGYAYEARDSALMYRISRDVKYCNHAVTLVEQQVSQAEAAIAAGQRPAVAADSYLEVGPMIADVAITYDTCAARVSSSQRQRWSAYAEQAIWNVWNHQNARWGNTSHPWSGWSVNNPGNNYYFSFVEATMLWALASRNSTWMSLLKTDKLPKLEAYYRNMPTGGSLEGTGYGTAQMRLFELYRIWRDATGIDLANANPHATNTIQWWVHGTVPTRTHFAPIGDQSRNSVPELYDYHRRLMLEARHLSGDASAQRIASWWLNSIPVQQMGQGANFRYDLLPPGSNGTPPSALHYHGSATGHLFARSGWETTAMWMSYVAGPYNESHAHQDQGAFTLYARDWLAVTENIWSRSGIQQGTEVHNTMRFERSNTSTPQCTAPANDRIVHQCESPQSVATMTVTPGANGAITVDSDLTPVYRGNPALTRWTRNLQFASRRLTVRDNFTLGSGTTAFFQVQVPVQPTVSGSTITAGNLRVRVLEPANATITLRNWNSVNSGEFTKGWRIDIGGGTSTYLVELSEVTP